MEAHFESALKQNTALFGANHPIMKATAEIKGLLETKTPQELQGVLGNKAVVDKSSRLLKTLGYFAGCLEKTQEPPVTISKDDGRLLLP